MQVPVDLFFENGYRQRVLTRDVSANGFFVLVNKSIQIREHLRFLILFPPEITTSCRLLAVCDGTVVRKEQQGDCDGMAVKIDTYQFLSSLSS